MIIQKVAKGIGISKRAEDEIEVLKRTQNLSPDRMRDEQLKIIEPQVQSILENGILCNWWLNLVPMSLPTDEVPKRLTKRDLYWHQNRYYKPDPLRGNKPFNEGTPFISTTAGTFERDKILKTNNPHRAKHTAFKFATNKAQHSGIVFFCYVFVIGKKSVGQQAFAEELRELNIYAGFSPWQLEGEVTAKIIIPPAQIEQAEIWLYDDFDDAIQNRRVLRPSKVMRNQLYLKPEDYHNIRELR